MTEVAMDEKVVLPANVNNILAKMSDCQLAVSRMGAVEQS